MTNDDSLRVVPQALWDRAQARMDEIRKTWPGGRGRPGFKGQQGGRVRHYPTELLSGEMTCGVCGCTMAKVSGKSGGYYGCLRAAKRGCENRILVRRSLVERIILAAVREALISPENLDYVLRRTKEEVEKTSEEAPEAPEAIRLREAERSAEERRVANFIEFIAEGRGSRALAEALAASEKRVETLQAELEALRRSREVAFILPPREWLTERITTIQEVLERRTERSALLLKRLLGTIRMEPVTPDIGRPYYRAFSDLETWQLWKTPRSPQPRGGYCWTDRREQIIRGQAGMNRSPVRLLCNGGGDGACGSLRQVRRPLIWRERPENHRPTIEGTRCPPPWLPKAARRS